MVAQRQLDAYYAGISREGGIVSKCEMWLPPLLSGRTVLDLGCRRGRGIYKLSEKVGENGRAIGIDPSQAFIDDAIAHAGANSPTGSYEHSNMRFHRGCFEDLGAAGIADASVDVVIVNSVLNLAFSKVDALSEVRRVLVPGGELYHATIISDRRIPKAVADPLIRDGSAFGGATCADDVVPLMREAGFQTVSLLGFTDIAPEGAGAEQLASVRFTSCVLRAFNLPDLEEGEEDYGQRATYLGAPGVPVFELSSTLSFLPGVEVPVSGNTAAILSATRYREVFEVTGNRSRHLGPFRREQAGR